MSNPNISNITPTISLSLGQTVPLLLGSIALEELALAHLLNAEAEKVQFVLGTLAPTRTTFSPATVSLSNLFSLDTSVQRTLRDVIKKEMLLEFKFENTLDLAAIVAGFGPFTFSFTGAVVTITVPAGAAVARIQALGAAGGSALGSTGGSGASVQGDFAVTLGESLAILVGGMGASTVFSEAGAGGGGGSFVWIGAVPADLNPSTLLVAAGGGGGGGFNAVGGGGNGVDASIVDITNTGPGTTGNPVGGAPGSSGNGGGAGTDSLDGGGGGGAGVFSNGGNASPGGGGGTAIDAGGAGGAGFVGAGAGGFGGGGGAGRSGGGGGGYSGGGGGSIPAPGANAGSGGGGGGSRNNGTNQVNAAGVGTDNGVVIITFM
ncbi:hypothetical protein ACFVSW_17715 [Neobacillus sp. NPDC058068]|uniref:hypothetical protein n=1 Tax=Neobacillus sp. NPDC058068 TaxID=3346325 RepID=UPI0036DEDFF3